MQRNVQYTVTFAVIVSLVASVVVATAAVVLRERQETNRLLDRQRKVLDVAGLIAEHERLSAGEVNRRFQTGIRPYIVELVSGQTVDTMDAWSFDQRERTQDPASSQPAAGPCPMCADPPRPDHRACGVPRSPVVAGRPTRP